MITYTCPTCGRKIQLISAKANATCARSAKGQVHKRVNMKAS